MAIESLHKGGWVLSILLSLVMTFLGMRKVTTVESRITALESKLTPIVAFDPFAVAVQAQLRRRVSEPASRKKAQVNIFQYASYRYRRQMTEWSR